MLKEEKVIDRVYKYLEANKVPPTRFEKEIGLSNGYLGTQLKRHADLGEGVINKILDNSLINPIWLLRGKGDMLISNTPVHKAHVISEPDPAYITGKNIRILPITVGEDEKERITLVNTRVAAGYADHLFETEYIHQLPAFSLPMQEFRSGTFRCFQVQGESMAPELKPGSYVIGRYVEDWVNEVRDGEVYIVVYKGEQRPVIKRLKNRVKKLGKMILQSDNIGYNTYSVDVEDVLEVWRYQAHLSFSISKTKEQIQQDITTLKADMALIMEELERMRDKQ